MVMKQIKRICITFVLFTICIAVNARSGLQLKSGSASFLRQNETAVIELDWSKATWEKYTPIKEYCENEYEKRLNLSEIGFVRGFNQNSKGLIITSGEGAKYKIVVHIEDFFQKSGGGWGRSYIILFGVIEVFDISSGNSVATVIIKGSSGDADFVQNDRFAKSFEQLGKMLAKMK